jgi:hypothetical protein
MLKLGVHPHPEPLEAVRLLYLILPRVLGWIAFAPRSEASKGAEIPVLRHQLPALRRQICAPKLSGADRAIISALVRRIPRTSTRPRGRVPQPVVTGNHGSPGGARPRIVG